MIRQRTREYVKCDWCWIVFAAPDSRTKYCPDCVLEAYSWKKKQYMFLRRFKYPWMKEGRQAVDNKKGK